ncbi:DUF7660 family protein [Cellulosimicrobium cellulans]|uniref:DUF7660 family protein n=1 Tax=Cellulosimicrobium cellulans TaxID=1710 RepID=UPI003B968821
MHYVCFHYQFEHRDFDVDESCGLPGCPSAANGSGKQTVIATARALAIAAAADEPWSDPALHEYLEALARWLEDSDGYYLNIAGRRLHPRTAGRLSTTPCGRLPRTNERTSPTADQSIRVVCESRVNSTPTWLTGCIRSDSHLLSTHPYQFFCAGHGCF